MKRSFLFTAVTLIAGIAPAAWSGDSKSASKASAVLGTWAGYSSCVTPGPSCKDEEVVYRIVAVAGHPDAVTLLADKVVNKKRVPMYKLQFDYDASDSTLSCKFNKGKSGGIWAYRVHGRTMSGTLIVLPASTLHRMVNVRRVKDSSVPVAPALDKYTSVAPHAPESQRT